VGINTALRISDLLQLQINHFLDDQGESREDSGSSNASGASRLILQRLI
jgi:hypothetical protein